MKELSNERIEQILHKESVKKEELVTILHGVYSRYMHLYEAYFADIDALNDDKIAELRKYHEETGSLIKYYYMDIPLDICIGLREFEEQYSDNLLGPEWRKYLSDYFEDFRKDSKSKGKSKEELKAEFAKQTLSSFYDAMGHVLRAGFGTGSKTADSVISGIAGLIFGGK